MAKEKITKVEKVVDDRFTFANDSVVLHDQKLETKARGYFKDAFIRFTKNKASVVASIIIGAILLFAIIVPIATPTTVKEIMDPYYAKKGPRNTALYGIGINGSKANDLTDRTLVYEMSKGVAAEFTDEKPVTALKDSKDSYYQPVLEINSTKQTTAGRTVTTIYNTDVDEYLQVGFKYISIEQAKFDEIRAWEKEHNLKIMYPLIDDNAFTFGQDTRDAANYWYKTINKCDPIDKIVPVSVNATTFNKDLHFVKDANGRYVKIDSYDSSKEYFSGSVTTYKEDLVLLENYKRNADGSFCYYEYTGGGSLETSQYKVRVLYYNYYRYIYDREPNYIFGTDTQGYSMIYRLATGVRLSLIVAVIVSLVNFIIGAIYGAIEGYYGGATDLIMERISDILIEVPFIIVVTLFQLHFAAKVGSFVCLLFAYITTGWIGTAGSVRAQFYRYKNQEYVLAARTLGCRDRRIMWKHIFPNTLGTLITSSVLVIPGVIFSESMLSYLGIVKLGTATTTSLGTLLSDASAIWTSYPSLMIFPAIVISLLMICFNLFGNGLRDAFNPQLRGSED